MMPALVYSCSCVYKVGCDSWSCGLFALFPSTLSSLFVSIPQVLRSLFCFPRESTFLIPARTFEKLYRSRTLRRP